MPQLIRARCGLGRDAAEFIRDFPRTFDLVLRCIVGAFGALGQVACPFEAQRQLVLDPIRERLSILSHHPPPVEFSRWLPVGGTYQNPK